jgi:hypothetical protein
MPKTKINVVQDEEMPVQRDVLAKAICDLSDSIGKLYASGLNQNAVIVLLQDSTKQSKKSIKRVLDSISQLRADYTL